MIKSMNGPLDRTGLVFPPPVQMGSPLAPSPPHAKVPTILGNLPGKAPWGVGRLEVNRLP